MLLKSSLAMQDLAQAKNSEVFVLAASISVSSRTLHGEVGRLLDAALLGGAGLGRSRQGCI